MSKKKNPEQNFFACTLRIISAILSSVFSIPLLLHFSLKWILGYFIFVLSCLFFNGNLRTQEFILKSNKYTYIYIYYVIYPGCFRGTVDPCD